jgi:hypothetical protein
VKSPREKNLLLVVDGGRRAMTCSEGRSAEEVAGSGYFLGTDSLKVVYFTWPRFMDAARPSRAQALTDPDQILEQKGGVSDELPR